MAHEHSKDHRHEGELDCCSHGHTHESGHSHDHASHDHEESHSHTHAHEHEHAKGHELSHDSGCGSCACSEPGLALEAPSVSRHPKGHAVFYIDSMDCSVEENDIRQILAKVNGIRGLNFQLESRTLSIDANREIVEKSVAAIKKAGYQPEPVVTEGPEISVPKKEDRVYHLWLALTIAIAVEILDFAGGDLLSVKIGGMALSAVAIWLSGFSTYRKGLAALMQRRFNINALMTVAVTGAFVIGQWPEAAMVMALVRHCRADRGAFRRSGSQCHSQSAGFDTADSGN